MPPVGFETTIAAGERPQTYGLDRAAIWTGNLYVIVINMAHVHWQKKKLVIQITTKEMYLKTN
jgi:hypothetical protein